MVLPSEKDAFRKVVEQKGTTMSDSLRLLVLEEIRKNSIEGDR